jgi:tetratricopeptide (TPR) repeat protein
MVFVMTGESEKAIPLLDKSIQLNSHRADPYYWRSNAFAQLGKQKQAEDDLAAAKAIDPGIADRRGNPLIALKPSGSPASQIGSEACLNEAETSPDRRITDCTAALEHDLDDETKGNALVVRAIAYLGVDPEQAQLAFDDANAAIVVAPKNSYAYRTRGLAAWDLGRRDDAMTDFDEAIRLEPQEAYHWFIRCPRRPHFAFEVQLISRADRTWPANFITAGADEPTRGFDVTVDQQAHGQGRSERAAGN